MVRNSGVEFHDDVQRPLIALGNEFPDGHELLPHMHRRHQLLYCAAGAALVSTVEGSWVIPPECGLWTPGGVIHEVRMLGDVSMRTLYLEPGAIAGHARALRGRRHLPLHAQPDAGSRRPARGI